jgi:hypothetical protein
VRFLGKFGVWLFMAMFFVVGSVGRAYATGTVDLTGVSLDTTSVLSLAAIILAAIGAIWGIKKLIKLANRS